MRQKSPADEREAYKRTLSEETAITNETSIKLRKPQFFYLIYFMSKNKSRLETPKCP